MSKLLIPEIDNEALVLSLLSGSPDIFQVTAQIPRAPLLIRLGATAFELLDPGSFLNADYKKLVICVKGPDLAKNAGFGPARWLEATIRIDNNEEKLCEISFTNAFRMCPRISDGKIEIVLQWENEKIVFVKGTDDDYLAEFIG